MIEQQVRKAEPLLNTLHAGFRTLCMRFQPIARLTSAQYNTEQRGLISTWSGNKVPELALQHSH
jgi:hypothetical protein